MESYIKLRKTDGPDKMRSKPFIDDMLYVVDGELMNHIVKSIIQCTNYPTGEVNGQIDDIDFEDMLWKLGIKLPNPNDPDNQYPDDEDNYEN